MLSRDHYAVLGVAPDADDETIEAAYRRLSRRYHPDLNPGDARADAAFERIRLAYSVLTDARERERYDREGHPAADDIQLVAGAETSASPASGSRSFQELFRQLCDHARRTRPQRGGDVRASVFCRLIDAERGRRTSVEIQRLAACATCSGRGRVQMDRTDLCATCRGSGREVFGRGALSVAVACSSCGGKGMLTGRRCPSCRGASLVSERAVVAAQIPPGVLDGQEIRLAGDGHRGLRGGPPGDLILTVRVQQDPRFERRGPDLITRVPISVSEAVLGARVPVPTLEKRRATVRIPPGVQGGQRLRVRGRGLEMGNGRRGDLLVVVEIWIPEVRDEDAKRLIREFGERTSRPGPRDAQRATVQR